MPGAAAGVDVGLGILDIGLAVGGPAGVGDADVTRYGVCGEQVSQLVDLAHRASERQLALGQGATPAES